MLNNRQFQHYIHLLNHPDRRQRIDALQDLFFTLLKGELLHPNQWEQLIPFLVSNIAYSTDATLRRWGYQVGTFSCNNNKPLVDFCINNLDKESDMENRSWMVALLSKNLPKTEFYNILSRKEHNLTNENINLATYLFTDHAFVHIEDVFKNSDGLSLMWVASIGAYKSIAERNKREVIITPKELSRLTGETDNDEVLKHVMYAFYLQNTFDIRELLFSPYEYGKMGDQQKKWFYSLIWKDKKFFLSNIDYFRELLSEKNLFENNSPEVRIGLARGLADSWFSREISSYISEWYSHEDKASVLYYLLKYIHRYQYLNNDYRDIVEYQKKYGRASLKEMLEITEKHETHYTNTEKQNIESNGGINFEYVNQVNLLNGNDNQAIYKEEAAIDWERFEVAAEEIIQRCNSTEKQMFNEVMEAIKQKEESRFKSALKKIADVGSDVFVNVTANIIVAYMKMNGI